MTIGVVNRNMQTCYCTRFGLKLTSNQQACVHLLIFADSCNSFSFADEVLMTVTVQRRYWGVSCKQQYFTTQKCIPNTRGSPVAMCTSSLQRGCTMLPPAIILHTNISSPEIVILFIRKLLTLYRPYLYSYPIGIALFETRLTSPLGQ